MFLHPGNIAIKNQTKCMKDHFNKQVLNSLKKVTPFAGYGNLNS